MARMPDVPFLGIADNGRMSQWDIICIHTIVGYQAGGNAAHFTTGASGRIVQARDTAFRSAANLSGNWHVIAIENEDHGPAYGSWSGGDVPRFTAPQAEGIARIMAWCHRAHNIPLDLIPDTKPGRRGIAYHRQGIDGNFTGPYGGRVSGGEVWSKAFGKVCPGDRRISQLINEIIPRARVLAGTEGEDMNLSELIDFRVTSPVDNGRRNLWDFHVQTELTLSALQRQVAAMAAAVADGDLDPEAVLTRVETAVREATQQAIGGVVLPALREVLGDVLDDDNAAQADAIVDRLADRLRLAREHDVSRDGV